MKLILVTFVYLVSLTLGQPNIYATCGWNSQDYLGSSWANVQVSSTLMNNQNDNWCDYGVCYSGTPSGQYYGMTSAEAMDARNRILPICSTYGFSSCPAVDYIWSPTFGGCPRCKCAANQEYNVSFVSNNIEGTTCYVQQCRETSYTLLPFSNGNPNPSNQNCYNATLSKRYVWVDSRTVGLTASTGFKRENTGSFINSGVDSWNEFSSSYRGCSSLSPANFCEEPTSATLPYNKKWYITGAWTDQAQLLGTTIPGKYWLAVNDTAANKVYCTFHRCTGNNNWNAFSTQNGFASASAELQTDRKSVV